MWLISFLSCILGSMITLIVLWFMGVLKCKHEWEKIIDSAETNINGRVTGYVVVHMCKKCGKRKITRV